MNTLTLSVFIAIASNAPVPENSNQDLVALKLSNAMRLVEVKGNVKISRYICENQKDMSPIMSYELLGLKQQKLVRRRNNISLSVSH